MSKHSQLWDMFEWITPVAQIMSTTSWPHYVVIRSKANDNSTVVVCTVANKVTPARKLILTRLPKLNPKFLEVEAASDADIKKHHDMMERLASEY